MDLRRKLLMLCAHIEQRLIRAKWKFLLGPLLEVGRNVYIDRGAKFEIISDGLFRGGRIKIGDGCSISRGVILAPYGGSIELGQCVSISASTVLYGHGGLKVDGKTMIAAHCVLVPAQHGHEAQADIYDQPETRRGIHVGRGVWIAAGCQILDGVEIGDGAVIAAGAVVLSSVPSMAIVAGVPAKFVKFRQ